MILNYLRILFFAFGVLIPGLNGSNYLESLEPVLWYSTDLEQYCLILDPLQTESISLTIICTLELLPTQDDMVNLQLLHNEVEIVQNTSKHSIRKSPYNARSNYKLSLDIVDFNEQDTGNYICRAVGFDQVRPPPTRSPQAMTAVLINSSATPCGLDHHSSSPTFRPKPPQVTQLSIFATLNNIRPASLDPTPTTCEPSTTSKQFSSTQSVVPSTTSKYDVVHTSMVVISSDLPESSDIERTEDEDILLLSLIAVVIFLCVVVITGIAIISIVSLVYFCCRKRRPKEPQHYEVPIPTVTSNYEIPVYNVILTSDRESEPVVL